jgi:hypothetical protein
MIKLIRFFIGVIHVAIQTPFYIAGALIRYLAFLTLLPVLMGLGLAKTSIKHEAAEDTK